MVFSGQPLSDKGSTNLRRLRSKWQNHNSDKQQAVVCRLLRDISVEGRKFCMQGKIVSIVPEEKHALHSSGKAFNPISK